MHFAIAARYNYAFINPLHLQGKLKVVVGYPFYFTALPTLAYAGGS